MKKIFTISIFILSGTTLIGGCLAKKMELFKTDDSADYAKYNSFN